MKKYKFIKPFSGSVVVGGFVGVINKSYKIGDNVTGKEVEGGIAVNVPEANQVLIVPKENLLPIDSPLVDVDKPFKLGRPNLGDIKPPPVQNPKRQPTTTEELPAKKDGKLDTNNLLLLGLGIVIVILLVRK